MTEVYGSREVSIVSPFDPSVGALVLEESVPAWVAAGWTIGSPEAAPAPAEAQDAPQEAPADPAQAQQPGVVLPPAKK